MTSPVESAIRGVVTKGLMSVAEFNRNRRKADAPNPFLTGVHEPVKEEVTDTALKVTGQIPAGLTGTYVRNGPNQLTPVNPAVHHWFLGDAMLHGVRLEGGRALWYRNRWVRSTKVSKALGEALVPGTRGGLSDNANTNIVGMGGKMFALVEAGGDPVEIAADLWTVAINRFDGTLKNAFSAHPHLDPETGEQHAICYKGPVLDTVWHTVIDTSGRVIREEPVAVKNGPMIHDCMITRDYVLILDLPVTFSMNALMSGDMFPYHWNPKHEARIGLLPRNGKGGDVIWCGIDPCFIFHPSNAYQTSDGHIVLDACVYGSMFDGNLNGPTTETGKLERISIDPEARRAVRQVIDDAPQEFPRPDERLMGKPYRFAYTMAVADGGLEAAEWATRLYRHDLEAGTRQVHEFGRGHAPGEFVFVPKHEGAGEAEGWLIGFVMNINEGTSTLAILDAENFEGPPVAEVHIPYRIPPGFHGNFIFG
jgi:carotenoid cleavage dioxygenase